MMKSPAAFIMLISAVWRLLRSLIPDSQSQKAKSTLWPICRRQVNWEIYRPITFFTSYWAVSCHLSQKQWSPQIVVCSAENLAGDFWFYFLISPHQSLSAGHTRGILLFQHNLSRLEKLSEKVISACQYSQKQITTQQTADPILFSHQSQFLPTVWAQWAIISNVGQSAVLKQNQSFSSLLEDTLKQIHETL